MKPANKTEHVNKRNAKIRNKNKVNKSKLDLNHRQNLVTKFQKRENIEEELDIKPAWVDEDDNNFKTNREDKLKKTQNLKKKYETLMGKPNWAKITKTDSEDDDKLLRSVGHLRKTIDRSILQPGFLMYRTKPPINASVKNEGPILSCVEFHPTASVSLVAGQSGVVSLYAITDKNYKLHSFKISNWKFITSAQFSPDGNLAYISSNINNHFYVYDLLKAVSNKYYFPNNVRTPKNFKLSHDGKYIAVSDGFDEVFLICAQSKELIKCLKHNNNVASLTFSYDTKHLYSYLENGNVTIWDLSTYKCFKNFYDQGCVTASSITISPCGKLVAMGSGEGIVNIYNTSKLTDREPVPLKVISNLTTKITSLRFNPTSEILALASAVLPEAAKLVHIPSYHVYMNFPQPNFKISNVHSLNFSPHSGYLSIGNNNGYAFLYRLKHFKNY